MQRDVRLYLAAVAQLVPSDKWSIYLSKQCFSWVPPCFSSSRRSYLAWASSRLSSVMAMICWRISPMSCCGWPRDCCFRTESGSPTSACESPPSPPRPASIRVGSSIIPEAESRRFPSANQWKRVSAPCLSDHEPPTAWIQAWSRANHYQMRKQWGCDWNVGFNHIKTTRGGWIKADNQHAWRGNRKTMF